MNLSGEPIIVLGAFRSGTSCVATALSHLGVYLGEEKEFQPADEFNQGGYWEIRDVQMQNAKSLLAFGMNFYQLDRLPEDWREVPGSAPLVGELRALLRGKFGGRPRWGWKEPATSILLPLYKEAFREEGIEGPKCPILVRHPLSVAASQIARQSQWGYQEQAAAGVQGQLAPVEERTLGLWLLYTLSSLREAKGYYRQVISYENFLKSPEPYLKKLVGQLEGWSPSAPEMEAAVASVNPEWSHSRYTVEDLREWPDIVQRTYELCLRADADCQALNAGTFDEEIEELWNELGTMNNMIRPIFLPAGQMIFSWPSGQPAQHAEKYSPSGAWQTFRAQVPVPPGSPVQIDPYQTPCQIWVRKASWHIGDEEKRALLSAGPSGALEEVFGLKRLTVFGPGPLMTQAPNANGPMEFEMEFLVQAGDAVLTNVLSMLKSRVDQARRSTGAPHAMKRRT